ncbi:polycystin family receptor for egg jelly-like isoform X3 [Ptychodera flava]|uniref:polycystin family receptor for egg jelly-like isoform X3 n=1 Tax=Ptychodera flava TaxID=63121 RepID=UPI00396A5E89
MEEFAIVGTQSLFNKYRWMIMIAWLLLNPRLNHCAKNDSYHVMVTYEGNYVSLRFFGAVQWNFTRDERYTSFGRIPLAPGDPSSYFTSRTTTNEYSEGGKQTKYMTVASPNIGVIFFQPTIKSRRVPEEDRVYVVRDKEIRSKKAMPLRVDTKVALGESVFVWVRFQRSLDRRIYGRRRKNWYFNGKFRPEWYGLEYIKIPYAMKSHEGFYEYGIFYGERTGSGHNILRLIVRECPDGMWGPPDCLSTCPTCYFGGMCDTRDGTCICAPGFSGDNCLNKCSSQTYGENCAFVCRPEDPSSSLGCKQRPICQKDPFGCSCYNGYTGFDCLNMPLNCNDGFFGELCTYKCHCKDGAPCHRETGVCPNGECAPRWSDSTGTGRCQQVSRKWGQWGSWTECIGIDPCPPNVDRRSRVCESVTKSESHRYLYCPGEEIDTRPCARPSNVSCPVIHVLNTGPQKPGENLTFLIFTMVVQPLTEFWIDFGDNSSPLQFFWPASSMDIRSYLTRRKQISLNLMSFNTVVIRHIYNETGIYTANVTGSTLNALSEVKIMDIFCPPPAVKIKGGGYNLTTAVKYRKYAPFMLSAHLKTDCQHKKTTIYQWQVYTVSNEDSTSMEAYDLQVTKTFKDIQIPGFSLDYGWYMFKFTVWIIDTNDRNSSNSDIVWLEIIKSEPIPRISGGSFRSTGWDSTLQFDASDSEDPDFEDPHSGLSFQWLCRQQSEAFPEVANPTMTPRSGGCFNDGMYLHDYKNNIMWELNTATLQSNTIYVVRLLLSKPGKETTFIDQTIHILDYKPPNVQLRCLKNCNLELNPSQRLILNGKCRDCARKLRPKYRWYLKTNEGNTKQNLDWDSETTTGRFKAYLSIKAGVFSSTEQEHYSIGLNVTNRNGDGSFAEYSFTTNSPPSLGSCEITPSVGTVLTTKFTIVCQGFTDANIPLTYKFYAITGREPRHSDAKHSQTSGPGGLLYHGPDNILNDFILPAGAEGRNYMVKIKVKVADALGASIETSIDVQVIEPETEDQENIFMELSDLASGTDSELKQLLASDLQGATQLITSATSILNKEDSHTDTHQREELSVTRKSRKAKLREEMILDIENVEVDNLDAVQQKASVLLQLTQTEEEVTRQAQISASRGMKEIGLFLKKQSHTNDGTELLEETASVVLSCINNIVDAASLSALSNESGHEDINAEHNLEQDVVETMGYISDAVLVNKQAGEGPTIVESHSLSLVLDKEETWNIGDSELVDNSGASFQLPAADVLFGSENADSDNVVLLKMQHFQENLFSWGEGSSSITSTISSLEVTNEDSTLIDIKNLTKPVQITMPQHNTDQYIGFHETLTVSQDAKSALNISVDRDDSAIVVEVNSVENPFARYHVHLDDAIHELPRETSVNGVPSNTTIFQPWEHFGEGMHALGISLHPEENFDEITVNVSFRTVACMFWSAVEEKWLSYGCQVDANTTIMDVKCNCDHLSFFGISLLPAPYTIPTVPTVPTAPYTMPTVPTAPYTLSTAPGITPLIEILDVQSLTLLEIVTHPIILTVIATFGIYFTIMVWALWKDTDTRDKVVVLEDNDPFSKYRYHVTVFTGIRLGAGTTSNVAITINGLNSSSETHLLNSSKSKRRVLQRGSVDRFLLTTQEYLGDLSCIRLWHDNSGRSPSWYIDHILVHDLHANTHWAFLANIWLSAKTGLLDITLPCSSERELINLQNSFITKMVKNLQDCFLFLNIFSCQPQSQYTRIQRLSCWLSFILCSMLVSLALFGMNHSQAKQDMENSQFRLTWTDLIIGICTVVTVIPVNLIIMQIFRIVPRRRKLQPREKMTESLHSFQSFTSDVSEDELHSFNQMRSTLIDARHKLREMQKKPLPRDPNDVWKNFEMPKDLDLFYAEWQEHGHLTLSASVDQGISADTFHTAEHKSSSSGSRHDTVSLESVTLETADHTSQQKTKKCIETCVCCNRQNCHMSSCCQGSQCCQTCCSRNCKGTCLTLLGWFMIVSTVATSACLVVLYGYKYDQQKSLDWLTSLLLCLVITPIIQPLFLALMAVIAAVPSKALDDQYLPSSEDVVHHVKSDNTEWKPEELGNRLKKVRDLRQCPGYLPPSNKLLASKEKHQLAEATSSLKELICYVMFWLLVVIISYSQQSGQAILANNVLKQTFTEDFHKITKYDDVSSWMNSSLVPVLYRGTSGTIDIDCGCVMLIGSARVRQVRVKPDSCEVNKVMKKHLHSCSDDYSFSAEDTRSFAGSWEREISSSKPSNMWHYASAGQAQGSYVWGKHSFYSRGGYIADLGSSAEDALRVIEEITESQWFDHNTRAVFVELTVYNAQSNLFSVVTLLFEYSSTGSVDASYEFLTSQFYKYMFFIDYFVLFCQCLYLIVMMYLILNEVLTLWHQGYKYFMSSWNYMNLMIVFLSVLAVMMFGAFFYNFHHSMAKFKSNRNVFTSFYTAALCNEGYLILSASLVFIWTLRLLKLLCFNNLFGLLHTVMLQANRLILSFTFFLGMALVAFSHYCVIAFGPYLNSFRNMSHSYMSVLGVMLGGLDSSELLSYDRVLAYMVFVVFLFSVVFILQPMFAAIMIDSFLRATQKKQKVTQHHNFISILFQKYCA